MEDNDLLRILSEELREAKALAQEAKRKADACQIDFQECYSQVQQNKMLIEHCWRTVEQNRELIIITRNQVTDQMDYIRLPWWKRLRF